MTLNIPFDNSYARLPERFFARQNATAVAAPTLIAFNHALAADLGIDATAMSDTEAATLFSGNALPDGAAPLAQAYAGHQFGGWSPQLGDGRALLLGEVVAANTTRHDIQLKGSGRTPFSRNGDGRAWLGPVLREYLMSEAMHAMDVPTTRALAAVRTGENVQRETALPGAVLTRTAGSHIRVGTFQFFAASGDRDGLRTLTDYTIARHYPDAQTPADLLDQVMQRQVALVAKWMGLGFIHGVMNTDNVQIAGETIDYGPCAFIDVYHPDTVFSSIDRQGRYAYSNQGPITHWNLAQFATSLVAIMPDTDKAIEDFTTILNRFPAVFEEEWASLFAAKLGLPPSDDITALAKDLLSRMADKKADFTNTFNALDQTEATYPDWYANWRALGPSDDVWRKTNPAIIPRTHNIEQVIKAATAGDFAPFHAMLAAVQTPFVDNDAYNQPPQDGEKVLQTFCGT
ncbi:MAG: YdiU family protein [Octadecabacter sp.]